MHWIPKAATSGATRRMLDMTGYSLEEIIGHSYLERTHEDDRDMRREKFNDALRGEPRSFESRYVARDGSVRFALVNSAPIIVDGQTTGVLGIAHDITEQKHERDRAARADKLRALGQLGLWRGPRFQQFAGRHPGPGAINPATGTVTRN